MDQKRDDQLDYARDTVIEIDLDAITHNVKQFIQHLPTGTQVMAAVKANAYGHGSIPIAKAALSAGASALGVAFVDEGVELRRAGITAPILILGYTPLWAVEYVLKHQLTLTVYSFESLREVEESAARLGVIGKVHVKVDTGMGRIGLQPNEVLPFVQAALQFPHVEVEGVFTHFATADELDKSYVHLQEERFAGVLTELNEQGIHVPLIHTANSAGAIELPKRVYDMVRVGISLYGYYPSREVEQTAVQLQPALTFKSRIVHLKQVTAGSGISYGKTYVAHGGEWIATIPVGYADGFSRQLSNRGMVLIGGRRVPIVGRICMDQLMVDVSSIMPVQVGDEVVVYGRQGEEAIPVEEVADLLGTINYEVTCMLSYRVPRIYLQQGQPVYVMNRLQATSLDRSTQLEKI